MEQKTVKKGRYHVLRRIGRGNRGEVFLVEDTTSGQQVALKLFGANASLLSSLQQDSLCCFDDEVKTVTGLCHPNILPLLDSGEEGINGTPFIVMPYCPEGSLAAWLQDKENCKALSFQDVAYIVRQAADALQYAHEHAVIHQNVKPSNFLFNGDAGFHCLMLSDFHMTSFLPKSSSAELSAVGSPLYMAPEQWKGQPVVATDQYALAVMTYLLLTGRPPFQGEELRDAHSNIPPALPSSINPIISQGIDAVLLRALEKEPGERFATISAFASAFEQIIQPMAAPAMVTPIPTTKLSADWDASGG
jgi:eukaryotic-like serine/threonine-protein kinase